MSGPMPRGDQLSRQWRLLQMIDRPQGVTVDDAARDLQCTIRTIWRDLDALQKAGFPLFTDRAAAGNRSVWRVTEDFKRALRDVRPTTRAWLEQAKNYAMFANEDGLYDDLLAYLKARRI